jgi:hypothetical protein
MVRSDDPGCNKDQTWRVCVSRVTAQCTGEGDKWREEATFYFSKGMLYFSRKQTR